MSDSSDDETRLVSHRVQLRHPQPFKWPTDPTEKRISKTRIGGQFQEAGRRHNSFLGVFHGTEVPPNRLEVIETLDPPKRILEELEEEVELFKAVVIHVPPSDKPRDGDPPVMIFGSLKGTVVVLALFRLRTPPMADLGDPTEIFSFAASDGHSFQDPSIHDFVRGLAAFYS